MDPKFTSQLRPFPEAQAVYPVAYRVSPSLCPVGISKPVSTCLDQPHRTKEKKLLCERPHGKDQETSYQLRENICKASI
jgi:hypothetical protein